MSWVLEELGEKKDRTLELYIERWRGGQLLGLEREKDLIPISKGERIEFIIVLLGIC